MVGKCPGEPWPGSCSRTGGTAQPRLKQREGMPGNCIGRIAIVGTRNIGVTGSVRAAVSPGR